MSKPRMLLAAAFTLALGLAAASASAAYREPCWLRYKGVRSYWSPIFAATCTYLTGAELNERTGGRRYHRSRTYVVVGWGYAPATAIRISQRVGCLFEADRGCADQLSHKLFGIEEDARDADGNFIRRDWLVCQPGIGRGCNPGGLEGRTWR